MQINLGLSTVPITDRVVSGCISPLQRYPLRAVKDTNSEVSARLDAGGLEKATRVEDLARRVGPHAVPALVGVILPVLVEPEVIDVGCCRLRVVSFAFVLPTGTRARSTVLRRRRRVLRSTLLRRGWHQPGVPDLEGRAPGARART